MEEVVTIFSVNIIYNGELRWNIYHGLQNQDKVTEPNTEGAEGNLDPSLQLLPPSLDLGANLCVWTVQDQIQVLWLGRSSGPAQKELEAVLSMSTDLRRYPQLVPVAAASHRLISWPEWIAGTFLLSQAAGVSSSDTWNRVGKNAGCSLLSWKNGHLNLGQLKWELSPIVQQWQASKCKTAHVFLSKVPEILGYVPCCSWLSRIPRSPEEPGHTEHSWEGLRSYFSGWTGRGDALLLYLHSVVFCWRQDFIS